MAFSSFSSTQNYITLNSNPFLPPTPGPNDFCWYLFRTSDISGSNIYNAATSSYNTSVIVGSPTFSSSSVIDTSGNYIKLPSVNLYTSTGFTFSCWTKISSSSQTSSCTIIAIGNTNSDTLVHSYVYTNASNVVLNCACGSGSGVATSAYTAATLWDNNWHFHAITLVSGSGACKIYYDGVQILSPSNIGFSNVSLISSLAYLPWNNWYLNGATSDVRMYNSCLTANQITGLFNNGRHT